MTEKILFLLAGFLVAAWAWHCRCMAGNEKAMRNRRALKQRVIILIPLIMFHVGNLGSLYF
jgi:hypothetical protein